MNPLVKDGLIYGGVFVGGAAVGAGSVYYGTNRSILYTPEVNAIAALLSEFHTIFYFR